MAEPRPTAADLAAARDRTIPDVTGPGLLVLFSGINPSLYSAATGRHFARPGNRFLQFDLVAVAPQFTTSKVNLEVSDT